MAQWECQHQVDYYDNCPACNEREKQAELKAVEESVQRLRLKKDIRQLLDLPLMHLNMGLDDLKDLYNALLRLKGDK